LHAWQGFQSRYQFPTELLRASRVIAIQTCIRIYDEHLLCLEARINRYGAEYPSEQKASPDQQHQRERHLRNHESAAQPGASRSLAEGGAA